MHPDPATWELVFGRRRRRITGEFNDLSASEGPGFPAADVSPTTCSTCTPMSPRAFRRFPPVTIGPLARLADELGTLGGKDRHYPELDPLLGEERGEGRRDGTSSVHRSPVTEAAVRVLQTYRF